jgi:hypothetical protein
LILTKGVSHIVFMMQQSTVVAGGPKYLLLDISVAPDDVRHFVGCLAPLIHH